MVTLRGKPFLTTWKKETGELKIYELDSSDVFVQSGAAISLPSTVTLPSDNFEEFKFIFFEKENLFLVKGAINDSTGILRTFSRSGTQLFNLNNPWGGIGGSWYNVYNNSSKLTFKDHVGVVPFSTDALYAFCLVTAAGVITRRPVTSISYSYAELYYNRNNLLAVSPDESKIFFISDSFPYITASRVSSYYNDGTNPLQPRYTVFSSLSAATLRRHTFTTANYPGGVLLNDIQWAGNDYCLCVGQLTGQDVGFIISIYNFRDPVQNTENNGRAEDVYSFIETLGQAKKIVVSPNTKLVAISFKTLAGVYRTAIYRRTGLYLQRISIIENFGAALSLTRDGRYLIDSVLGKAYTYVGNYQFEENTTMMANVSAATLQGVSLHSDTVAETSAYNFYSALANRDIDFDNLKLILLTNDATFDATDLTVNEVTNNGAYIVSDAAIPVDGIPLSVTKTTDYGNVKIEVSNATVTPKEAMIVAKALIYDATTDRPLHFIDLTREVLVDKGTPFQLSFEEGLQWYTAQ